MLSETWRTCERFSVRAPSWVSGHPGGSACQAEAPRPEIARADAEQAAPGPCKGGWPDLPRPHWPESRPESPAPLPPHTAYACGCPRPSKSASSRPPLTRHPPGSSRRRSGGASLGAQDRGPPIVKANPADLLRLRPNHTVACICRSVTNAWPHMQLCKGTVACAAQGLGDSHQFWLQGSSGMWHRNPAMCMEAITGIWRHRSCM